MRSILSKTIHLKASITEDYSLNKIDSNDSRPKFHIVQELGRGEVLTVG
jgi:hypothetical protein